MFSLEKTKMAYQMPQIKVAGLDPESALLQPTSETFSVQVDRLKVVKDDVYGDDPGSFTYFE